MVAETKKYTLTLRCLNQAVHLSTHKNGLDPDMA